MNHTKKIQNQFIDLKNTFDSNRSNKNSEVEMLLEDLDRLRSRVSILELENAKLSEPKKINKISSVFPKLNYN